MYAKFDFVVWKKLSISFQRSAVKKELEKGRYRRDSAVIPESSPRRHAVVESR
jgi:hypothetical protein